MFSAADRAGKAMEPKEFGDERKRMKGLVR